MFVHEIYIANSVIYFMHTTNGQCSDDVQFRKKIPVLDLCSALGRDSWFLRAIMISKKKKKKKIPSKAFLMHYLADAQSRGEVASGDRGEHPQKVVCLSS